MGLETKTIEIDFPFFIWVLFPFSFYSISHRMDAMVMALEPDCKDLKVLCMFRARILVTLSLSGLNSLMKDVLMGC